MKNLNDVIYGDRSTIRANHTATDWKDDWNSPSYKTSQTEKKYVSCYHSHPPLPLPGTDFVIYGGSCSSPVITDADVYIGFDYGMKFKGRPWHPSPVTEVLFEVQDMGVPKDVAEYQLMVEWTKNQLILGKKVHCGCIGGHGRTGMFFAALVSSFGEPDAITYVRKNYCEKAVESSSQVKFLGLNFGVLPAIGAKEYSSSHSTKTSSHKDGGVRSPASKGKGSPVGVVGKMFEPVNGKSLWS